MSTRNTRSRRAPRQQEEGEVQILDIDELDPPPAKRPKNNTNSDETRLQQLDTSVSKARTPPKKSAQTDGNFEDDFACELSDEIDLEEVSSESDIGVPVEPSIRTPIRKRGKSANASPKPSPGTLDRRPENYMQEDFSRLSLRLDHEKRPTWVCPNLHIYLEAYVPQYKEAYDFLIAVANPVSRTKNMHIYQLNQGSLYGAVSIGFETEAIINTLDSLSKVDIPKEVTAFIKACTDRFGKLRLVLRRSGYFIESSDKTVLEQMVTDEVISSASKGGVIAMTEENESILFPAEMTLDRMAEAFETEDDAIFEAEAAAAAMEAEAKAEQRVRSKTLQSRPVFGDYDSGDESDDEETLRRAREAAARAVQDELAKKRRDFYSVEIDATKFEDVKRRCVELEFPLLEEYDFNKDILNPNISINLKATTRLRQYQEKALSKLFNNGRVRSGIISLPCGAGKSLVGVTAATTIKKRTLVLCTSGVSVQQWQMQFKLWTTIHHNDVVAFTPQTKAKIRRESDLGSVLVTTYSMMVGSTRRTGHTERIIEMIESLEWGLIVLDEVHVVPANTFRRVISKVKSHCRLGLTATLVREDEMIDHLLYLIGPKVYEANWLDLVQTGHIANVRCAEVWCPMTAEFYSEYLHTDPRHKQVLYIMNPNKIKACQHLIKYHESRSDKVIVFSDSVFALKTYAKLLDRPFIYGGTPTAERIRIFSQFQYNSMSRTIFVSKVGDNSIDLPEANVIIQISSHYGSRRQEAQRLGRILRPKARSRGPNKYDAFFYSLVSQDTKEAFYAAKRQQFLVEQGYGFKVYQGYHEKEDVTLMASQKEQLDLLAKVIAENIDALDKMEAEDTDVVEADQLEVLEQLAQQERAWRDVTTPTRDAGAVEIDMPQAPLLSYTRATGGTLEAFAGGHGVTYEEFDYD